MSPREFKEGMPEIDLWMCLTLLIELEAYFFYFYFELAKNVHFDLKTTSK